MELSLHRFFRGRFLDFAEADRYDSQCRQENKCLVSSASKDITSSGFIAKDEKAGTGERTLRVQRRGRLWLLAAPTTTDLSKLGSAFATCAHAVHFAHAGLFGGNKEKYFLGIEEPK